MKAKGLMVGDLIKTKNNFSVDNELNNKYCKVQFLGDKYIAAVLIDEPEKRPYGDECHFEEIPLTPEILDKNGFNINGISENMQPVEERDWSDNTYLWSRQETPNERMQVSVYMDDSINFFAEIICQYCHVDGVHIKYVHELQNTLRLCGINKEIII